jgi:hypothetical protein
MDFDFVVIANPNYRYTSTEGQFTAKQRLTWAGSETRNPGEGPGLPNFLEDHPGMGSWLERCATI